MHAEPPLPVGAPGDRVPIDKAFPVQADILETGDPTALGIAAS